MKRTVLFLFALVASWTLTSFLFASPADLSGPTGPDALREQATKARQNRNFLDAFTIYEKLSLSPDDPPEKAGGDLLQALYCLRNLNRVEEVDAFREKVIAVHAKNWLLLLEAAESFSSDQHWGFVVGGEFYRGQHRGEGRYVSSEERDRVRSLQLMEQALQAPGEKDGGFYLTFANLLLGNRNDASQSWRLHYLTDLKTLPDYEEGYNRDSGTQGAPVDENGDPVWYRIPASWEKAANDGERWRWLLVQAMEDGPCKSAARYQLADFLHQQFDVHTLSEYRWYFCRPYDGESDSAQDATSANTFALETLGEDETQCRLANGIKRFKIPDEFNYIKIYQQLAEDKGNNDLNAIRSLATLFENRRQFDKAIPWWERYQRDDKDTAEQHLRQITGNWGAFEPTMTHPAGTGNTGQGASLSYRFRNGTEVSLEAWEINVRKLLDDVKAYIKSNPYQADWKKENLESIGMRLVQDHETAYLAKKTAAWTQPLTPRPGHFDRRVTITTPLQQAGAYLVTATMKNGNVSRIIVWVNDTVLVKKPLDGQDMLFVADAVTGAPVSQANVEFFGYRREWKDLIVKQVIPSTEIMNFAEFTNEQGLLFLKEKDLPVNMQWLMIATTPQGRLAYLGFTNIWFPRYYDQEYNQIKVYTITDRPVYRPKQAVKFKFWLGRAQFDQDGPSPFAGQNFSVVIANPKREKVYSQVLAADAYGGLAGEWNLPSDAPLGVWNLYVDGHGGSNFRVEEYKKPEFEVTVEAPTVPVMLGEKITATIKAKYYFGAPVINAKIKYRVLRHLHESRWYPSRYWDWCYGPGYWWFAYDCIWYPGWARWGCLRPWPWWWPSRSAPPELVASAEAEIGKDGTLKVAIDTAAAQAMHPDSDHRYEIVAEVTDQSRRTIVGQGDVLVARTPFRVYAWVDRGYFRAGDDIHASFRAQALDGKPIKGNGQLALLGISYDQDRKPVESSLEQWNLDTDAQGEAQQTLKAAKPGQYRLSYTVLDDQGHRQEGGYLFTVRGEKGDAASGKPPFRFNDLELIPDRQEYAPGDKVGLQVNTDRAKSTVLLFVRPCNGIALPPKVLTLTGQSVVEEIEVVKKDLPNFFVEALTISDNRLHSEIKEIVVPPEQRVLNVSVEPAKARYLPGEKASVKLTLTDLLGKPWIGSLVLSVYDKAVEYISGGSNVPEIRAFFWKWRRSHHALQQSNLERWFSHLGKENEEAMGALGIFGDLIADEGNDGTDRDEEGGMRQLNGSGGWEGRIRRDKGMRLNGMMTQRALAAPGAAPPGDAMEKMEMKNALGAADSFSSANGKEQETGSGGPALVAPTVRTQFADTAFWSASISTDPDGCARVDFPLPENLTGWKIRTWAMGAGTKVGENTATVVTAKNVLVRLQAPRFFVQKDEVVLSANVHNCLATAKKAKVILELDGPCLKLLGPAAQEVTLDANAEKRVDWRVAVAEEGEAVVRMKALTDEESDAMEMKFPAKVHGMEKQIPFCGLIRPEEKQGSFMIDVPQERRINASRLEIRYSPTLAMAMVDALPYLADYPYGCTEQTLNRFLPSVITQNVLKRMGVNLKQVHEKRTNLNAQEIGDDRQRAAQWQRCERNPVWDEDELLALVKQGVERLTAMQCSDGGWGWFSGYGEYSYPHTTAVVVHGLQVAQENGVALVPGTLERGIAWLKNYQAGQVVEIKNGMHKDPKPHPWKPYADHLDALVYEVLSVAGEESKEMHDFLYRDRVHLSLYSLALFALALDRQKHAQECGEVRRNLEQYLVEDKENQTAWLNLGNEGWWWCWYGSEIETLASYLKLLARVDPKGKIAPQLVKYLLNNRKHATYWNSTRDTSLCLEAFADYLKASGEDKPDLTLEVLVDGKKQKEVRITPETLFTCDNKFLLWGDAVETGKHTFELRKTGTGPLYFNAYLSYFTLEDYITQAGLEIKVERTCSLLQPEEASTKVSGSRGQAVDQKVEKYRRVPLADLTTLKSGDLVEIELVLESKNDYEYVIFEDLKAAGCEPVEVRSGYSQEAPGTYVEFRDDRVSFFMRSLARGRNSLSYRLRAEIPGKFSALPARAYAMYAPELQANSDEIKLQIEDK